MDKKYMERALELAALGEGNVNPNPMVGAVVVKDGKILGEGYHKNMVDLMQKFLLWKKLEKKLREQLSMLL